MSKIATLAWTEKTDLIAVECECPICNDKYLHGVPYVTVPCKKCGQTYKTDFKQSIYHKKAKQVESLLSWNNSLTLYPVSEKFYRDLVHLKDNYERMRNWDVSDITRLEETFKYCKQCGLCLNCYQCKDCKNHFRPDPNRRKQRCPNCKSSRFIHSHFLTAEENKCPHCKSKEIRMTRTTQKTKCHVCKQSKLTEAKTTTVYSLTIERKGGYKI